MKVKTSIIKTLTIPSIFLFIFIPLPLFLSNISVGVFVIGVGMYFLWLYFLNRALDKKMEPENRMPSYMIYLYNLIIIIWVIYLLISYHLFDLVTPSYLFPLHFGLMISLLMLFFVISRNLVVAEGNGATWNFKFYLTVFWFLALPIGIFFLQPRIIKCLNKHEA